MKINRVCQGDGGTTVSHRFNEKVRKEEGYEQGVSLEMCPLYDFSLEPWMLINHVQRQMILAYSVIYYLGIDKVGAEVKVLDVGCGYGELFHLLRSYRKAGGTRLQYIGVDIDKDKKIVAEQLRSTIDYRIMDVLAIENIPELPVDCIVCAETLEHVEESKGVAMMEVMAKCLAPGGLLIMSVPTPDFTVHRDNPFHLREWKLKEVCDMAVGNGLEILDSYHLGVAAKYWPGTTKRLPRDLMRATMSAFSSAEGTDGIMIARRPQ